MCMMSVMNWLLSRLVLNIFASCNYFSQLKHSPYQYQPNRVINICIKSTIINTELYQQNIIYTSE